MRKGSGKAKGSGFEREICVKLSEWWTRGERSDIFWRSSNSGGRATVRSGHGKVTKGQHSDIAATDPIGQPLLEIMVVEVKRGYSRASIGDLLDRPTQAKPQTYEEWETKAQRDAKNSGFKSWQWILIHKRDRRTTMVYMPERMLNKLIDEGEELEILASVNRGYGTLVAMTFDYFLANISPEKITQRRTRQ